MKIIKSLLIAGVFLTTGCVSDDYYDDIPISPENGEYEYTASSIYRDASDEVTHNGNNTGTIYNNINSNSNLGIVPWQGWSYSIQTSNLETHFLKDGSQARSFKIPIQSIYLNGKQFNVKGTTSVELRDSDGTVIGQFDGVNFSNGKLEFGVLSMDLADYNTVTTSYKAIQ